MTRAAVLLANAAKSPDSRLSVTRQEAQSSLNKIAKRLDQLGSYSFDVFPLIVGEKESDARQSLRKHFAHLGRHQTAESCLLFYYFGHGVERSNDLYFHFKDSNTAKMPTMIGFREMASWIFGHQIQNVIFVLDCCYAGASVYALQALAQPGFKYSILASAIPTQRAMVRRGSVPFGAFSSFLFEGLRDLDAVAGTGDVVTVDSLFDYTARTLKSEGYGQQPYKVDGGLGTLTLSEPVPQRKIWPEYNKRAPRKSFYSKMWWIATKLRNEKSLTLEAFYRIVEKERPVELLTPVKRGTGTVQVPVSKPTFEKYLTWIVNLGFISEGRSYSMTATGRKLLARGGAEFNDYLLAAVEREFKSADTSLSSVDKVVRYKSRTKGIPTAAELYLDVRLRDKLVMKPDWFSTLVDLAALSGYFRFASQKTYFPY